MLEITAMRWSTKFSNDQAALDAAIRDGVKCIPIRELPEGFPYRWLGWLDTPKNRKAIKRFAKQYERYCI